MALYLKKGAANYAEDFNTNFVAKPNKPKN
jgi:hypothetical protein